MLISESREWTQIVIYIKIKNTRHSIVREKFPEFEIIMAI